MPFGSSMPPHMNLGGLDVIADPYMTETVEDWSDVRSPARARRRRRQGHPQRIRYVELPKPNFYQIGNKLVGHPEMIRRLTNQLSQQAGSPPSA